MRFPRTNAEPTPFDSARADEIFTQAHEHSRAHGLGMTTATDFVAVMTDGEDEYVREVWKTMPGSYCWENSLQRIRTGKESD